MVPILIGINLIVFLLFFMVNTPHDMARQALGEKAGEVALNNWMQSRNYHYPYFLNTAESGTEMVTKTIFYKKSVPMFWLEFGNSDMAQQPIRQEITTRILPSIAITLPIFFSALFFNIVGAMLIAYCRGTYIDTMTQFLSVLLMSISPLLFIIAGQFLFAKVLKVVPVSGFDTGLSMIKFLILPVCIGFLSSIGAGIRLYRTFFLEEINKDYVRTARAKGLSEGGVLFVHVLKNALIPILTNVPLQLILLMMGNLLLENFFSIPGLGNYTIQAINSQDFSIVRSMVFFTSVLYVIGLLLVDICYSIVDPRIRLQ